MDTTSQTASQADSRSDLHYVFRILENTLMPPNTTLELELRLSVDARKPVPVPSRQLNVEDTIACAKELIAKYSDKPSTVEQTINFIKDSHVTQLLFVDGTNTKRMTSYVKTQWITPVFLTHNTAPTYRLSIATETKAEPLSVAKSELVRVRVRYSIQVSAAWRLDITLVSTIESAIESQLKELKQRMFYPMPVAKFSEVAPWNIADCIEFELECTKKPSQITIEDLQIVEQVCAGTRLMVDSTAESETAGEYQETIYRIAQLVQARNLNAFRSRNGLKQLSNQVIELTRHIYRKELAGKLPGYYITDKVDGKRTMLLLDEKAAYMVSDVLVVLPWTVPKPTVLDGEVLDGVFYVFDCLVFQGENLTKKPFVERLSKFDAAVLLVPPEQQAAGALRLATKPWVRLTAGEYRDQIIARQSAAKPYPTDGLVLTPASETYFDMRVYKYKPREKLTIDFLIKKCPDALFGTIPFVKKPDETLYLLFCGISKFVYRKLNMQVVRYYERIFPGFDHGNLPDYMPVQFQPSDKPFPFIWYSKDSNLDGQVGEFGCMADLDTNETTAQWDLHRIREDRAGDVQRGNYFGNNYKIAENIWNAYQNPLSIEDEDDDDSNTAYFQARDDSLQKASRTFNSIVKSKIFEAYKGTECAIDIASGKGQDLFRYATYEFRSVVFLEIDRDAIGELLERKFIFAESRDNPHRMRIYIRQMNMMDTADYNSKRLASLGCPTKVPLVQCQFAFHYFLQSIKTLNQVCKFISGCLIEGGAFVFTAFDGAAVVRLLNRHKCSYIVKTTAKTAGEKSKIIYAIKPTNPPSDLVMQLATIGQPIDVWLPFSSGYYTEYLVNQETVVTEFKKHGMVLESMVCFSDQAARTSDMTDDDVTYTSLYHTYTFRKRIVGHGREKKMQFTKTYESGARREIVIPRNTE